MGSVRGRRVFVPGADACGVCAVPLQMETHFKQVGVLAVDPENQQPKVKLYKDSAVSG